MAKLLLLEETDSHRIYPVGQEITREDLYRVFNESQEKRCYIFFKDELYRAILHETNVFKPVEEGNYTITFVDKSDESFSYAKFIRLMKEVARQREEAATAGTSAEKKESPPSFGSVARRDSEEGEKIDKTGRKLQLVLYYSKAVSAIEYNPSESTRESISLEDFKGKRVYYDSVILTATNRYHYEVPLLIKAMKEFKPRYLLLCLENFNSLQVSRIVLHLKPKKIMVAFQNPQEKLGTEIFEIVRLHLGLVIKKESSYSHFLEYLELHSNIGLDFGLDENLWTEWTGKILKDWYEYKGTMKLHNQLQLTVRNGEIYFELENMIPTAKDRVNITDLLKSLPYEFSLAGKEVYLICKEKKPAERILLVHKVEGKKQSISIRGANFWIKFLTGLVEELDIPRDQKGLMIEKLGNTREICDIYDKLYGDDDKELI